MEAISWMALGAALVCLLVLLRLAAQHGWAWVRAQLKARADAAEADFKAKVSAAAGDLAPRITAIENQLKVKFAADIDKLKDDVAQLQAKVPH